MDSGCITIDRKKAIANFELNASFLTEITAGDLDFSVADKLVERVRNSRAKTVGIEIAELLNPEQDGLTIDLVLNAIAERDPQSTFVIPAGEVINPGTGDKVKIKKIELKSTAAMMYQVCWITARWLEIANPRQKEQMVTGHIWPDK